jgi:hypothetical protein
MVFGGPSTVCVITSTIAFYGKWMTHRIGDISDHAQVRLSSRILRIIGVINIIDLVGGSHR